MNYRGSRVKELRKRHKDSLKDLAAKIDYDFSNLSKIERGVYKGSIDIFERIASVYNIDVSYFIISNGDKEFPLERLANMDVTLDGKPISDKMIKEVLSYSRYLQNKEE